MTTYYIVPHTHWDREWYEPFQVFRARLVDLVDKLIPVLENDPGFKHFMLDGQMAVVDDYLEIRPEMKPRLEALISDGRLAVGPWQILMDEFLVSGENTIRNLRKGLARASEFGDPMPIGYLPDMFGHISQIPQILSRSGISDALLWRGVPNAVDKIVFDWKSPDGSSVRVGYLATSYSNGAQLPIEADALKTRMDWILAELAPFDPVESVLVMNGTDHIRPQPELPKALAELQGETDSYRIASLNEYMASLPSAGLTSWEGELRSGARANLLMGVVSNRVDLRLDAARAEDILERYAEPLATLYSRGEHQSMLELAWSRLIDNAAHDSICGCSVDAVMDQVAVRFLEAEQLATEVRNKVVKSLSKLAQDSVPSDEGEGGETANSIFAFNPSAFGRSEVAIIELSVPESWDVVGIQGTSGALTPTQELEKSDPILLKTAMTGSALIPFASMLNGRQVMDFWVNSVEYIPDSQAPAIRINVDTIARGHLDVDEQKAKLIAFAEQHEDLMVEITARRPSVRRLAVKLPAVPSLSWGLFKPVSTNPAELPINSADQIKRDGHVIESKLIRLEVNDDGTVNVLQGALVFSGCGRLVDGADWGDTYNYSPPEGDSQIADPESVEITPLGDGPLSASIKVTRAFAIPARFDPQASARSAEQREMVITDTYEIRSGEPFVRVKTKFENACRDHRLRVHFPLPFKPSGSDALNPFDVVHRGLEAEGGPHEVALPTYPARGFVDVSGPDGGLALMFEPVTEYEVLEDEIALTLLRSVGMLSQRDMKYRPLPAGPDVPSPEAQCLGEHEFAYAICPHAGDWFEAGLTDLAERFVFPLYVTEANPVPEPSIQDVLGLDVKNAHLSACYRDNGRPTLRFWATRNGGRAGLRHEAVETDILGRLPEHGDPANKSTEFLLGPFEIKTIAIT